MALLDLSKANYLLHIMTDRPCVLVISYKKITVTILNVGIYSMNATVFLTPCYLTKIILL